MTLGQQRLADLAAGTVLAQQGLREYQDELRKCRAVVAAAVAIFKSGAGYDDLEKALRKGGFLAD